MQTVRKNMINPGRAENRLKATEKLLATTPPNTPEHEALTARKSSQEKALADKEAAYPSLLAKHLRHCSQNHMTDNKGRKKTLVKNLRAGIKEEKRPGQN